MRNRWARFKVRANKSRRRAADHARAVTGRIMGRDIGSVFDPCTGRKVSAALGLLLGAVVIHHNYL